MADRNRSWRRVCRVLSLLNQQSLRGEAFQVGYATMKRGYAILNSARQQHRLAAA
jgi:hypothetical protein